MSEQAVAYEPAKQRPWRWFGNEVVRPVLRSPAAWVYAVFWVAAAAYLAAVGYGSVVLNAAMFAAGLLLFCVFTVALTETPPAPEAAAASRGRLALQALAALFFIAITGYSSLAFHGLITAEQAYIPIWSPVIGWFGELGARYLDVSLIRSPDNALANPASYFLLPLPVLLLLGARWRGLGFGRGHRTGRVLLLLRGCLNCDLSDFLMGYDWCLNGRFGGRARRGFPPWSRHSEGAGGTGRHAAKMRGKSSGNVGWQHAPLVFLSFVLVPEWATRSAGVLVSNTSAKTQKVW